MVWRWKSRKACTIWVSHIERIFFRGLGMFCTYPYCRFTHSGKWRYTFLTPHIFQPEYQNISSNSWISLCSSYDLQHTSSISKRSSNVRYVFPSMSPLYLPFGCNWIVWKIAFTFINTVKIRKMPQKPSLHWRWEKHKKRGWIVVSFSSPKTEFTI